MNNGSCFFVKMFGAGLLLAVSNLCVADDRELIPYQSFTLDNGLRLIVHEDRKAPVVAVNVWYHVGSRNEKPGMTGYAHLFEHLMFQGSENSGKEYLNILADMGATERNGTTSFDRTNYYQTVPIGGLDKVLFLESDRMGHMLGAIDQALLDEQRSVVQNEKRQGDNQPYSSVFRNMLRQLFPPDHPYSWEIIGSMDDLEAASLEQMKEWFRTYYGPDNAVLVVAGDVDAQQVRERVQHYFGDIPPGSPLAVHEQWIPRHTVERRMTVQDRVPQEKVYMAWTGPRWGTREAAQLSLALDVLGSGKNSRLYERLVYEEQLVSDLSLAGYFFEIAGVIALELSVKSGEDRRQVERIAREELARLIDKGPGNKELQRVKTVRRAGFLRGLEKVGGAGSKSSTLAEYAIYQGDPGAYSVYQDELAQTTREQAREQLAFWLGEQAPFVAHYVPFPALAASAEGADRSQLPEQSEPEPARFPEFSRTTLDNGMELLVIERPNLPLLNLNLLVDAGYASDPEGLPGVASMAMSMLDEGAGSMGALEISEVLAQLGARLSASASLDTATVSLSALSDNLDASLAVFAQVALEPRFPADELERIRNQYLTKIQQEKSRPVSVAMRLMPALLYGEGHPYAQPMTGSGTEHSVARINRDDLAAWHDTWFRPNNSTLVVVGDTTLEAIKPRIEKLFASWKQAKVPEQRIAEVAQATTTRLFLVDKPAAEQSIILAGQLFPPKNNPQEIAIEAMNDVIGGQFAARINMNLREDKSWSYGAFSFIRDTAAQRPWLVYAPVQSDKTGPAVAEMHREISQFLGQVPATEAELMRVRRSNILSLPGRWETNPAVLRDLSAMVTQNLPDDYWQRYIKGLQGLDLAQLNAAARDNLAMNRLVWVIIGDRASVEDELRALDIGSIQFLNADGQVVE